MNNKKVVGSMSDWSGMLKDLLRQINDGSITFENLCLFLEHKNPFDPTISEASRAEDAFVREALSREKAATAPFAGWDKAARGGNR